MALTRKFCKGLGLTDEQTDSIIEAHTEVTDAQKTRIAALEKDTETLATVQKELNDIKNGKDWKTEYDKVSKELSDYKAEVANKETLAAKEHAFRKLLTAENIPAKFHDRIVKMTDFDKIEMDGENVKDEAVQRNSIKSEWGEYVGTTETHGAEVATPPSAANPTVTRADIYKKDEFGRYVMSTADRQKMLAEHPELLRKE